MMKAGVGEEGGGKMEGRRETEREEREACVQSRR